MWGTHTSFYDDKENAKMKIQEESVDSLEAKELLEELSASLEKITGNSGKNSFKNEDVKTKRSVFAVAREEGKAVGCGGLREVSVDTGELKRIYSAKCGQGIGGTMLRFLEEKASHLGYRRLILETRKVNVNAVNFYLHHGYKICENYGKYIGNEEAGWFEKKIGEWKMRSEKEMYHLILEVAKRDERVLAVYMNGSRTNPNVPKDMFQDYDIIYVVNETKSFREDKQWIHQFGKILFMQYPEETPYYSSDVENCYGWLMQFDDGNRIDLHVETVENMKKSIHEDKLCKILLDKEGILPEIPESTDEDYWVKCPTQEQFAATCYEFWWLQDNVGKGLWRQEILYVMDMINYYVRPMLVRILSWKAGIKTEFSCSVGKAGKYLNRYISKEEWDEFLETYSCAELAKMWESAIKMCELFDRVAKEVAAELNLIYNEQESKNSLGYLRHIKTLPSDAETIY